MMMLHRTSSEEIPKCWVFNNLNGMDYVRIDNVNIITNPGATEQDDKSSDCDHTDDRGDGWQDSDFDITDGIYRDHTLPIH